MIDPPSTESAVSAVDPVARLIAGGGLAVALGALAWQVTTWVRSGPSVSVEIRTRWVEGQSEKTSGNGDWGFPEKSLNPRIVLTVRNTGRSAIDVSRIFAELPGGDGMWSNSPGLFPVRLDAHSAKEFSTKLSTVFPDGAKAFAGQRVRGLVKLANGRSVRTSRRKSLKVPMPRDT